MVEPRWRMQKWRLASYQRESRLKSASDSAMRLFSLSQRLPSMGVSERETTPETRMAAVMVMANSCSTRPMMPAMNMMGTNTMARDRVMEMMVNPISLAPSRAACMGVLPFPGGARCFRS